MMIAILVSSWLVLSLLIAILGRRFRFGFWGYFFGSLLLTPVFGFLLYVAAIPAKPMKNK
jgi:uncharacterized membrane protein